MEPQPTEFLSNPLTGETIHIVTGSHQDESLDESSMSAFRVPAGKGICMRAGCWHTTRADAREVKCLMPTTIDLIAI
jgi:ureidoglycolate lyase